MEIVLVVMIVFAVAVVAWLTLAQSGEPPRPGAAAPEFRLPSAEGEERALSSFRGARVAIVFHPQDETPECLAVVQRLAEAAPAAEAAGAVLASVVVSGPQRAKAYAAAHDAGFLVLCDADGGVARRYGALVNLGFMKFARKLIVLADAEGRVERVWRDPIGPQHVDEMLAALARPPR